MPTCAECSETLLDYLYGLLDDAEVQALQSHLAGCAACQGALAAARAQQGLLGRAALKVPSVPVFRAPGAGEEITTTPLFSRFPAVPAEPPATPATPARPRLVRRSRHWAIRLAFGAAAAIVVAAAALYMLYHSGLVTHQKALAQARADAEAVDARLTDLAAEFKKEKGDLATSVKGQFLHVQLLGPATYQGSAATAYRVTTQTPAGLAAPAHVAVRLVARAAEQGVDQILFQEEYDSPGDLRFLLPGRLPIPPAVQPRLHVEVRGTAAKDVKEVIDHRLVVEPPSYLTHLCLNKTTYRIGEVVLFRTLTLDSFALRPVEQPIDLSYSLCQVNGPKLEVRRQLQGSTQAGGIGGGEFPLSSDLPEGDYLVIAGDATHSADRNLRQAVQRLHIFRDDQPRLLVERGEYQPGQTMELYFQGRREQNAPATANQKVTVTATTKNDGAWNLGDADKAKSMPPVVTDAEGNARFKIPLPKDVPTGELQVDVQVGGGKQKEKLSQTVRVVPAQISGEFFPEGGDLVAGVPNRVYTRLRLPEGEGVLARLTAVVEDSQAHEITKLPLEGTATDTTRQQVLGSFTFTPQFGQVYRLRLTVGDKHLDRLPLPAVVAKGISLSAVEGVVGTQDSVRVQVRASEHRQVMVLATCRGRTVDQKIVTVSERGTEVTLDPVPGSSGVIRVTVYDKTSDGWQPTAERLVYRNAGEYLKLSAKLSKESGQGNVGTPMRARVEARTEAEVLAPAWLHAMVWKDNDRPAGGSLPAFFLLTGELRDGEDLEDADILLAGTPAAAKALDLYLGTQGWRRFKTQPPQALAKLVAKRTLEQAPAASQPAILAAGTHVKGLQERYEHVLQDRMDVLAREAERKAGQLDLDRRNAMSDVQTAAANLDAYEQQPLTLLRYGVAGALVLLIVLGTLQLLAGLVVAWRARRSPRTLLAGAFASQLLAVMLFAGTQSLRTSTEGPLSPSRATEVGATRHFAQARPAGGRLDQPGREQTREAKVHASVFAALADGKANQLGMAGDIPDLAKAPRLDKKLQSQASESPLQTYQYGLGTQTSPKDRFEYATRNGSVGAYGNAGGPASPSIAPGGMAQDFMKKSDGKAKGGTGGGGFGGPAKKAEEEKGKDGAAGLQRATPTLREFAPPQTTANVATALPDVVLWHPLLFAGDGTAEARFTLPNATGTYHITVFGHTSGGRLGACQELVK
jgi:hypothetical protein